MAGTNTPSISPRMARAGAAGATSGLTAGHIRGGGMPRMATPRVGAGGGSNPISTALGGDAEGFVPTQDIPIHSLGTALVSAAFHPMMVQRAEEEQARLKAFKDENAGAQKDVAQRAVSSYDAAMRAGETAGEHPNQTMARWMASPEGIQAMLDKQWPAVGAIHQMRIAPDVNQQPNVVPLPNGLTGVQANGQWHVLTPRDMNNVQNGSKPVMGMMPDGTKVPGHYAFNPDTGKYDFTPATSQGQAIQPAGKVATTPPAQLSEAEALRTVLESGQKMLNNLGATGSLGWGSMQNTLAVHSPLSGAKAEAYAEAYKQMEPALVQLNRVQGQSKIVAQLAMDNLPKPGNATAFLLNQQLPAIMLGARERVGDLYGGAKAVNKQELIARTEDTVRAFDALPAKMSDLRRALSTLAEAPNTLTPEQTKLLARESSNGRLPYDATMAVSRQMVQMGLMDKEQATKAAAADPNFTQAFSPRELRADRVPLPDHMPQPGTMTAPPPMSGGGLPGQGGPLAPQQQQGQGELHPPIGGQPQPPTNIIPGQGQPQPGSGPQNEAAPTPSGAAAPIPPASGDVPVAAGLENTPYGRAVAADQAAHPNLGQLPQAGGTNPTANAEIAPQAVLQNVNDPTLQQDIAKAATIAPDPANRELIDQARATAAIPPG